MTDINEELLKKSAEELNAPYYVLDVTKPEDWQSVLGNIETEFSQLNILTVSYTHLTLPTKA